MLLPILTMSRDAGAAIVKLYGPAWLGVTGYIAVLLQVSKKGYLFWFIIVLN
jgi:hypothetical protein